MVYKIIQTSIFLEMHQTFMHARTPTHNLQLWPKRPLCFFFFVAEMSIAEMSGPKHPRPKCPTFGPGVTANKNNLISIYTDYYRF